MSNQFGSINSSPPDLKVLFDSLLNQLREKGFIASNREYSSLLDLVEDLDSNQYLWLRNEDNFKNILSCFCITGSEFNASTVMSQETYRESSNFQLPNPETILDDVYFHSKFDKLISRFKNIKVGDDSSVIIGEKLSDIIQLKRSDLLMLPGIGSKYIDLWVELKKLYQETCSIQTEVSQIKALPLDELKYKFDFDGMAINYSALSFTEKKNIEKLARLKQSDSIVEVVNFKPSEFKNAEGVGKKFISSISGLNKRLHVELNKISSGEIDYKNMESELVVSTRFKSISIEDIGAILLEDIDKFLDRANEDEQEIFQCRWGFVEPESTLEELGLKYQVSRERIRQKESKINNALINNIRLTQENIWLNIKDNINSQLPLKMDGLSSCFGEESNFYRFLGYISGGKDIQKAARPDIQVDMLSSFFATHGEPCSAYQIKEYIQTDPILDHHYADNVLKYLEHLGKIKIDGVNVSPRHLKKNEAAACVLSSHPQGLPWLDIAKIVNSRGISRTNLNETRLDNQALFDSEFVYLAGKGIYKNIKYINFSEINIDSIFESLLKFFNDTNRDVFHLNEVYHNSVLLQKQDYHVIRYIVKIYGEDYGFYFYGKSQTDSVGLKKGFKNITQKDVILQAMNTSKKPLTKPEIANLLKSNSLKHASYYLDQMITDEQVVQVDRMLYTTPDIAYKDIDLSRYVNGIHSILLNEKRPVDPSIFQSELNGSLHASYSKYFYASIAKKYHQKNTWYRKHNLYSLHAIKYSNLTDAINRHCKSDLDANSNFKILSEYISITRESAQASIANWQQSLNHY